jgi:ATP-dependent exoDNAse (exonuclease V) beta subunit
VDELERFFESDFYGMLSRASRVHRETRFHLFLPAERFTQDAAFAEQLRGEELAVQGVIDLFFEEADGLVLVDFKSDRVSKATREARAAEYAGQKDAAVNKALSESLTEVLLEYYAIKQWDGKMPEFIAGMDEQGILALIYGLQNQENATEDTTEETTESAE